VVVLATAYPAPSQPQQKHRSRRKTGSLRLREALAPAAADRTPVATTRRPGRRRPGRWRRRRAPRTASRGACRRRRASWPRRSRGARRARDRACARAGRKRRRRKSAPRRRGAARRPLPGVDGAVADAQEVLESPELRGRAGADEVLVGQEQRRDAARRRAAMERAKGLEASPARAKVGQRAQLS
jgi:hypothetical protein